MNSKCLLFIFLQAIVITACKPSEESLYFQGVELAEDGEHEKAIKKFTQVIELNSQNDRAYFERGISWYIIDSSEKALDDLNYILDNKPALAFEVNPAFATGDQIWKVPTVNIIYQRALVKYGMDSLKASFIDFMYCAKNGYEKARSNLFMGHMHQASGNNEKACYYYKLAAYLGDEEAKGIIEKDCQ